MIFIAFELAGPHNQDLRSEAQHAAVVCKTRRAKPTGFNRTAAYGPGDRSPRPG
jgi:hypothetical protein